MSLTLHKETNQLISGSVDGIKFREVAEPETCAATVKEHYGTVLCLLICHTGHVISGSRDCQIKIWDPMGHCIGTLEQHTDAVQVLIECGTFVVSGSNDGSIKIWDPVHWVCLKTIRSCSGSIKALCCVRNELNGLKLVSGGYDRKVGPYITTNIYTEPEPGPELGAQSPNPCKCTNVSTPPTPPRVVTVPHPPSLTHLPPPPPT